MNAKDLMIGDWVFNEIPCYVTAIYHNGTIDCQGDNQSISTDSVDPIPLTAEILEKNGFAYKEADETCATESFHHWYLVGSRFAIDDDSWWRSVKDGELHVKFGGFPLKYVHQLQHALRLAGIDKEIKL